MTPLHRLPVILAVILAAASGCDSTNTAIEAPEIEGTMEVTGGRGTDVAINLNLKAESGISALTLTVDGGEAINLEIDEGATELPFTYTFAIPAGAEVGTIYPLVFTLVDQDDVTTDILARVTTGRLIEPPVTYAFTRDGVSTVAYPGQTDRLDQLAEIKAYLRRGDAGELLSEQALLDMFANTGDNGGGHFSFTSDRQLKNKTFAPDLDARLFETFFVSAAEASVAGNNGVMAANGTAGLIVRENSGNTILVDENGREFTQLIEKGLMGAVIYNQIYNTYLTDDRIGRDVENIATAEGQSYTAKEHHMDEAFGYWSPPIDFTSGWPAERASEDRFWSHYSNTVDNVNNGLLGTNSLIMNAFIRARTAIVNNEPDVQDEQRDILYEGLDLVAAGVTVHYINSTLEALNEGNIGEAFHTLSEAWAFANALRYNPRRVLSVAQIEEMMESDFGADGNFWNVTPAGLNRAKNTLVEAYPQLLPVQDDL